MYTEKKLRKDRTHGAWWALTWGRPKFPGWNVVVYSIKAGKRRKLSETKIVTRTQSSRISSPNFHIRLLRDTLKGHSENVEFWWAFVWKLPKYIFQKHASTLDVAMVTKGGQRRLENIFVLKNTSFKLSESFEPTAKGVLQIFEEVYQGARCRPPGSDRVNNIINTKNRRQTGDRKRDCVWGCARGINTTWENLQIEKHKSVR